MRDSLKEFWESIKEFFYRSKKFVADNKWLLLAFGTGLVGVGVVTLAVIFPPAIPAIIGFSIFAIHPFFFLTAMPALTAAICFAAICAAAFFSAVFTAIAATKFFGMIIDACTSKQPDENAEQNIVPAEPNHEHEGILSPVVLSGAASKPPTPATVEVLVPHTPESAKAAAASARKNDSNILMTSLLKPSDSSAAAPAVVSAAIGAPTTAATIAPAAVVAPAAIGAPRSVAVTGIASDTAKPNVRNSERARSESNPERGDFFVDTSLNSPPSDLNTTPTPQ